MEPKDSFLCSQELDRSPCHELDESNSHFPHYWLKSHFNNILIFCLLGFYLASFFGKKPTFRDYLSVPSSGSRSPRDPEDGTGK